MFTSMSTRCLTCNPYGLVELVSIPRVDAASLMGDLWKFLVSVRFPGVVKKKLGVGLAYEKIPEVTVSDVCID